MSMPDTSKQQPDLDLSQFRVLEEWELAFVRHLLEGNAYTKAGELTMQAFPELDLRLTARNAQRLANKEHIKLAYQKAKEISHQTTKLVTEHQIERVQSILPTVTQTAIENLNAGLLGVAEGIIEMRALLKGQGISPGLKIGALGQLTNTVQVMVKLSGIMQTETKLVGHERETKAQGMSDQLYEELMGNVLVDFPVEATPVETEEPQAAPEGELDDAAIAALEF